MTAELKEQIARGICRAFCEFHKRSEWENLTKEQKDNEVDLQHDLWKNESLGALSAIEAAGYVVVPREPTREMIDAGMMMASCELADEYRAMVEAATKG